MILLSAFFFLDSLGEKGFFSLQKTREIGAFPFLSWMNYTFFFRRCPSAGTVRYFPRRVRHTLLSGFV